MFKKLQKLDYWIAVPYATLSAIGVVMVFSASENIYTSPLFNFLKQLLFVLLGWGMAFLAFHFSQKELRRPSFLKWAMIATIILLIVARLAPEINGAHGWIQILGFTIQPVELAKVILILYFADLFDRYPWHQELSLVQQWRRWRPRITSFFLPLVILVLITIMPDLGNLAITLGIIVLLWMASGLSRKVAFWLIVLGALAFIFLPEIIQLFHLGTSHSYAIRRLTNFVDPWVNVDQSRQLLYSYYAVAHGGLFGVGLGNSLIKPYLPEANTDFIMAVATEELGALVVCAVLVFLFVLIGRLLYLAIRQGGQYRRLFLVGVSALLLLQAFVNLGGVIGLLPITGVVFPFISGGGSSFIVFSAAIGFALNIAAKTKQPLQPNPQDVIAQKDYR
ncbi:FtsW/RodA/SpoVE family cell cycle protein [Convivina intestini]|uniref:FtsW/RodA/SpoVE family cell cycle protein n=1 Tax=Convivina intestini TaxID=1505726 RepID=UPI00200CDEE1|nr:FtsW/RodA/SpoVE family cell cycle protein [Convivina intestini]CAH1850415.1 putative peptidoglycan glycosyltransferase FtsW [Convivina intestini]